MDDHDLQKEVEVPRFFVCPISLEIMKDPVTLSTGITYDRESIEKWLFSHKKNVCPVTRQAVIDIDLTPNHTLCRLIQSWCTLNPSNGIERIPTPRLPISKTEILKLLKDSKSPHLQMKSLKRLKALVLESDMNKRTMEAVGAANHLASIINNTISSLDSREAYGVDEFVSAGLDKALSILNHLNLSPSGLESLLGNTEGFVDTLTCVMQHATSYESRTYAVMLLKSMFELADPMQTTTLNPQFFTGIVQIVADQISEKATKETLKLLINLCNSWGRNRIKAAEAGAVSVLIDTLIDSTDKRLSELIIIALDQLCRTAEGRAEFLKHSGGLAVVSKKIFRVSTVASERAVRVLHSVAKYSGNRNVLQEMLELGVVGKLCLALQVDCGRKTKENAIEILKMHSRVWKKSPCIPYNLISSYPS